MVPLRKYQINMFKINEPGGAEHRRILQRQLNFQQMCVVEIKINNDNDIDDYGTDE